MRDRHDDDRQFLWHPYTQMKDAVQYPPIRIDKAEGMFLYDDQGRRYYDTIASWWCNVHGHNHPKIVEAITQQLQTLDHVLFAGFTHKGAIDLAGRLVAITPENLRRVFFSDNGSTAVEVALKMSLQYWAQTGHKEKTSFVALDRAYHGDTVGAMSVSGPSLFTAPFESMLFKTYHVPTPDCYRCPMGREKSCCDLACIAPLETVLKTHHERIAAMILEPLLMGAGGMIVYPAAYLQKAAELARQYGVHLILDEVATGFGRTGKMFACEHAGVEPNFMCLSKGITSGTLPLAVTLTTEEVYEAFYDDYDACKTFYHGHTFTANPIGCAAALASLKLFEDQKTLEMIQPLIKQLQAGMERFTALPLVGNVRGIGMMAAIELAKDKDAKTPFAMAERIGQRVFAASLEKDLILRPLGNVIYLWLPLCVTAEQLDEILDKTYQVIAHL